MTELSPEAQARKDRDNALSKAYSQASRKLREAHPDEFAKYMEAATSELGVEWKRRVSAEERAEQEFQRLLDTYPFLREKMTT